MDGFKEALIDTIKHSKAKSSVDLMCELIKVLYLQGYLNGQEYLINREETETLPKRLADP